jgi:hypothetical protein
LKSAVTQFEDHAYCLSQFVPGEYFGGRRGQWIDLLALCASFLDLSKEIDKPAELPRRPFFGPEECATIAAIEGGAEISSLAAHDRDLIIRTFHSARAEYEGHDLEQNRCAFHMDIHPHNLICDGDRIALLTDIESIHVTSPLLSLGFAVYKCLRELLVASDDARTLTLLARECASVFPNHTIGELVAAARADLLRRALSITRSLLRTGQSRWEFMLETQLTGLVEVEYLCAQLAGGIE